MNSVKRIFDCLISLLSIPFTVPLMIICGLLIKLCSSGPIFFRQKRIGLLRKPFYLIKFRTMCLNAEKMDSGLYTVQDDPRFTKVGLFLRRFSLDELPQIFNILAGTMSIVGPRPLPAIIINEYPREFDIILKVKPGITGLSQVSGRNELPRSRRLQLDMFYAENHSFRFDLQILFKTIGVVLGGKGQLNYRGREEVEK